MDERNEQVVEEQSTAGNSEPIKRYKSVKTKSFVNRNYNDPNGLDFSSMSREQLVVEASRLQSHVTQLKNLLEKASKQADSTTRATDVDVNQDAADAAINKKKKKVYKERPFNFDNYNKRHVFLKFAYLGW